LLFKVFDWLARVQQADRTRTKTPGILCRGSSATLMESNMKNVTRILSVSAILMGLASSAAHADTGMTREQVRAELVAAEQSGDISFGQGGQTLREMWPQRYAKAEAAAPAAPTTASAKPAPVESSAASSIDYSTLRD
jgi:hypothetical protein